MDEDGAIRRLARHDYAVLIDADGYLVQHRQHGEDVSRARTLAELLDLADLVEWRAQRSPPS